MTGPVLFLDFPDVIRSGTTTSPRHVDPGGPRLIAGDDLTKRRLAEVIDTNKQPASSDDILFRSLNRLPEFKMNLKPGGCSLHLDVPDFCRRWAAEPERQPAVNWTESQSVYGSALLSKRLYAVRSEPSQTTPLTKIFVTLYPTRGGQATRMLSVMGSPDISSASYLSHHDARAATREDRAQPEQVFLAVTVPDLVFDRVWSELDAGASRKMLRVQVIVHCLMEEHWMEQYYIQPDSVCVAVPFGVAVTAPPLNHTAQV